MRRLIDAAARRRWLLAYQAQEAADVHIVRRNYVRAAACCLVLAVLAGFKGRG